MFKSSFFVTSDTHFGHKNIIKYCDRPQYHEELIIANWRKVVNKNDEILHLGDLMMGGDEVFDNFKKNVAPKLTGKKYIILGNHDKRKYDYESIGFEVIQPFSVDYRGYEVSFSHYPKLFHDEKEKKLHVHGHIHNHTYSRGEVKRWGNINVCVEVTDYMPKKVRRLLNREIRNRNQLIKLAGLTHEKWQQANTSKQRLN